MSSERSASKVFKNIRDKGKAAIKNLGRKRTPSTSRAPSACGSAVSLPDPAVSLPSAGDASTSAIQANSINPTAPPSAPPIAGTLETLDRVEALQPLGQPGTEEPGGSSSSGRQLLDGVPQISISEPEQDNGKWLWKILYISYQG